MGKKCVDIMHDVNVGEVPEGKLNRMNRVVRTIFVPIYGGPNLDEVVGKKLVDLCGVCLARKLMDGGFRGEGRVLRELNNNDRVAFDFVVLADQWLRHR